MTLLPPELTLFAFIFLQQHLRIVSATPIGEGIWQIDIFNGPAPSPDSPLSPPGAAGALRDRSKLKFEIIGIVGAYVVWLIVTLLLIFFVGLKLRRRAQSSNRTISMEMIKTAKVDEKALPSPGPLSPGKMASLRSWASGNKHKKTQSNATGSTVDTRLVQEDRQKNMDEMAKLYAHVMAHEQERESMQASSVGTSPSSPTKDNGFHGNPQNIPTPPVSPQYQNVPELQHLRQSPPHPSESPYYYPPPQQVQAEDISRATTRVNDTPRSFASRHERTGSNNSNKLRPSRISVRGKPISEPIGDADLSQSFGDNENTPLSPRLYTPGPAPPTPSKQQQPGLPSSPRLPNPSSLPPPVPPISHEAIRRRAQPPNALPLNDRTNSNADSLPFRQIYASTGMTSAPSTKTTFLHYNNRNDILGHHPKTGVPQTPYSPYMPMTPMTPVTPSMLVGRKDMKKQKKQDGLKVLSEDDMVKSDDDMWN